MYIKAFSCWLDSVPALCHWTVSVVFKVRYMLQKRKICLKRFNPCLTRTGSEKFNETLIAPWLEIIRKKSNPIYAWKIGLLCNSACGANQHKPAHGEKFVSNEKCCLLSLNQLYLSQLWICLSVSFCTSYVFCLLPAVSLCQPCHTCVRNLSHAVSYACLSVVSCLTCLCELFSVSCSCQLSQ